MHTSPQALGTRFDIDLANANVIGAFASDRHVSPALLFHTEDPAKKRSGIFLPGYALGSWRIHQWIGGPLCDLNVAASCVKQRISAALGADGRCSRYLDRSYRAGNLSVRRKQAQHSTSPCRPQIPWTLPTMSRHQQRRI